MGKPQTCEACGVLADYIEGFYGKACRRCHSLFGHQDFAEWSWETFCVWKLRQLAPSQFKPPQPVSATGSAASAGNATVRQLIPMGGYVVWDGTGDPEPVKRGWQPDWAKVPLTQPPDPIPPTPEPPDEKPAPGLHDIPTPCTVCDQRFVSFDETDTICGACKWPDHREEEQHRSVMGETSRQAKSDSREAVSLIRKEARKALCRLREWPRDSDEDRPMRLTKVSTFGPKVIAVMDEWAIFQIDISPRARRLLEGLGGKVDVTQE